MSTTFQCDHHRRAHAHAHARVLAIPVLVLPFVLALASGLAAIVPARAGERPVLSLPLSCSLGTDCFVQNHVDDDPGPGARDFACKGHTYDGHKGIDIRLPTTAAMSRGVAVLAVAGGTVLRVRDSMDDISIRAANAPDVTGRECGNGLVIDHGDGWETQYCHLKRGSIAVAPGDEVARGQAIAEVGLSGRTEFPHVHLGVRHDGRIIDPMTGELPAAGCGKGGKALFEPAVATAIRAQDATVINAGFAARPVDMADIEAGTAALGTPRADMPALVFFARAIWLQAGDRLGIRIEEPSGRAFIDTLSDPVTRDKAQMMRFAGKRRPAGGWTSGTWRARFRIMRDGEAIAEEQRSLVIP